MKRKGMDKLITNNICSPMQPFEVSGMVKILFYTSEPKQFGTEITCMLALSAENSFEFQSVYDTESLKQLLQNAITNKPIVILAAMSHQELDELLLLKKRHDDLPTVLLLADETDVTLKKAHMFRPKFLTTVHHDFKQVISVVEKLCKGFCSNSSMAGMHIA